MLKQRQPRLVFYQMQNACSLTIKLILGSKQEMTKRLNLLRTSSIWDQWLRTWLEGQKGFSLDSLQQNEKSADFKAATINKDQTA